jgi:hypothetical protein
MLGDWPWDKTAALFVATEIKGIFDARGGGRHGQLVTGRSISMVPPRPVTIAENITIKRRMTGFGLKWPGDGVALSFFEGDF